MAEQIGNVNRQKSGLMPSRTKHLNLRNDSSSGVLLFRLEGAYTGAAIFYTTMNTRGQAVRLCALTASSNADGASVLVKTIVDNSSSNNISVKYTYENNILSVYLLRNKNIVNIGAEVIYNDGISNFLENVDAIPSGAIDATLKD